MKNIHPWFIKARIKTRHLLLLDALAREGSMHRAAELLHLTQPAASKLLKDLEDNLGLELFERLPRGMKPTLYGQTMIRHAQAALGSLQQAHEELQAAKLGRMGHVRIGAITTPSIAFLPSVLAQIKSAYPGLEISVQVDPSNVLIESLQHAQLDIVIGRLSAQDDKRAYVYEPFAREDICAAVRKGHPLTRAQSLTLQDIQPFGWLVPPTETILRKQFDKLLQQEDLELPPNSLVSSSILFATKMLQSSDLVCVAATDVARYYEGHGLLSILPLTLACDMEPFGFITLRDGAQSAATTLVLEAMRKAAGLVQVSIPK